MGTHTAAATVRQPPFVKRSKHGWSDIAFPTDGRSISESIGDLGDRICKLLPPPIRPLASLAAENLCRQNGSRPGSKVLGGEVTTSDLLEIIIHVRRGHRVPFAALIPVLEKRLPRQVPTPANDSNQALVVDEARMALSALASELESHGAAAKVGMSIAQSG
jgi:hypothetical protein